MTYRAFISFSHESDQALAVALKSSLTRFAKPWYRIRSMRVFQDEASLAANPALWDSIQEQLAQSEYFILLASPASAHSRWVEQEIRWWVTNRSVAKLVICLTDGSIGWDDQRGTFDGVKSTAIPEALRTAFTSEPLYADFRAAKAAGTLRDSDPLFRSALLNVAAPLMGRPKDELDGEDIRLHRKARRTALAAGVAIVLLGVLAGVAAIEADRRQKVAASRALASQAATVQDDRSLALLLSIESRNIRDTVESKRALLGALQRVPGVDAFLWGHTDAVTRALFSPDGKTVLSAGWDDRLIEWDAASHRVVGESMDGGKGLVGVAFSADGAQFASTATGLVTLWNAVTRQPVGEPLRADEDFLHVAFSPDGKLLAASTAAYGAHPARIYLWDVASRGPVGDPIPGSTFAFSPDNASLAVAQFDELLVYDLKTRRFQRQRLQGHTKNIASVAFSPDGDLVAAGAEDTTVVVWDVKSGRTLGELTGHVATVESLLFDPRAALLYSGSHDGTIIQWNLDSFQATDVPLKNGGAAISSIDLTPAGELKALALDRQRVIMLHVADDPPLGHRIKAPAGHDANIAYSPDGQLLATSAEFGEIVLRDPTSGLPKGVPLPGHERQVTSLTYSADGKVLVSGSIDGSVRLWDTDSRQAMGSALQADGPVWSLASSPDGKTLVAGGDAAMVFWDAATGLRHGAPVKTQNARLWALAFSPDGQRLAAAGNSLKTDLWRTEPQVVLDRTVGTSDATEDRELMPVGAAFSPDGGVLATSAPQHAVALWSTQTGQSLPPLLLGHAQAVAGVVFIDGGTLLASGSADGDIRLWDVDTHEWVGTLSDRSKSIRSLAKDPRRQRLASMDDDDDLIFWDVGFEDWVTRACRIANRELTAREWSTYLGAGPPRNTCPAP